MIEQEFLNNLPDDPVNAILEICKAFDIKYGTINRSGLPHEDYKGYLEWYALLESILTKYHSDLFIPKLDKSNDRNINTILSFYSSTFEYYDKISSNLLLDTYKERFSQHFESGFAYEFSDGDIKRIQELINELRDIISTSNQFIADHKERLLKKLENLQGELHKRVSSLDKFWGLIGDAGVALGKFGKDSKPFVDRIKEIAEIVWNAQARAEGLSSSYQLPFFSEEDIDEELPDGE